MAVIIADANGQTDSAYHTLVRHIPSPIPLVMVSWCENFVFNEALLELKEWILVDFCEYGWNYEIKESHIWGANTDKNGYGGRYVGEEWHKFDNWVRDNPPKIIFKRELLAKDVARGTFPIEYPCLIEPQHIYSKEDFDAKPINLFHFWGRSNECRIRMQEEIWLHAFNKGFQVCDNIYYVENYLKEEQGEKWVSLWIPHWARIDINQLMFINSFSKLSLSLPGAGFKCFRTGEVPVNSVMVMHKNDFAFTHDWDETNCILVEPGKEIEGIEAALKRDDLYDIYLRGVENIDKYRIGNYTNHLKTIIDAAI